MREKVSKQEADRRKAVALAEHRELQVRRLRGELLEREAVKRAWAEKLAVLRDRFLALPDRAAAMGAHRDERTLRELLAREIEEALRAAVAEA